MANFLSPIPDKILPDQLIVVSSESIRNELIKSAQTNGLVLKAKKKFFDAFYYYNFEKIGIIGPLIGSPAAVIAAEPFFASGLKKIIILGHVGGISLKHHHINIGDTIFPTECISDEGTSKIYGAPSVIIAKNQSMQKNIIQQLKTKASSEIIKEGPLWTTDAPYRESETRVKYYSNKGVIAVDMEYSALCHLANLYEAEIAGCFVVSDLLGFERKIGFNNQVTKNSLRVLIEILTTPQSSQYPSSLIR